ncbi:MAG TPA: hypothetical protein VIU61_14390 [Kofleriaceae bacterium]
MRNLVFVFAALAVAPACTSVETAFVTANWTFHEIDEVNPAAPPRVLPCPAGFDTAEVRLTSLTGGLDFIDAYSCGAGTGTEAYDADLYDIELIITNDAGQVYAVSPSEGLTAVEIDTRDVDKTVNFSIADNGGYFGYAWDLVDAATNAPLTCGQAGADSVEVVGTMVTNSNFALGDRYPCEDGAAVTPAFPAGEYTVSAAALNTSDLALGEVQNKTTTMGDRNDFVNLGTVILPID